MAALRMIFLLLLCVFGVARAAPMRFVYPPPEAVGDERHLYYWQLLDAALSSNRDKYGDYSATPFAVPMSFQRGVAEVESGGSRVNIISRATNRDLEKRLLPIRIPLDKGLLGARLFLIMPETQSRLDQVRTLADLRRFTIGQSSSWSDVAILQSAGFKLVQADAYLPLFSMLGARRFDLFSRGAIEIEAELASNQDKVPGLMIDRRLLLYYPMPRYFFVPRTADGERMAERIADGLLRLRRSGEFERRYQAWKKLVLKDLELSGRTLFRLPNPELSPETPLADKYWWDDLAAEVGAPR
ncbi:MAG: hypothetical protein H6R17_248 [Proteobacteria bacterium]|nr:hypothetical protein [Pseudomonadota bacterium]